MSKHTPGPWKVTEFMPDENGENLITDTYQEICAGAGYLDNDPGGTMIGFSCTGCMTKHDAHLIAAAPEMLEMLIEASDELSKYADADHNGERYVPNSAMRLRQEIEELIAKAEGRP